MRNLIGSPEEQTITAGYVVYPESFFAKMRAAPTITVRPPEVTVITERREEVKEEKPEVRQIAEEAEGLSKYIPWIILGIIILGGK